MLRYYTFIVVAFGLLVGACTSTKTVNQADPVLSAREAYDKGWEARRTQRYAEAMPLFRRAADLGHPEAQLQVGALYDNGQGVERNFEQAMVW